MDKRIGFYRPYKGLKLDEIMKFAEKLLPVFIVPIRDWNMFNSYSVFFELLSFYRPYKGLKPCVTIDKKIAKESFYRPYKGLKLLHVQKYIILEEHVFIVPIRDWNSTLKSSLKHLNFVFIVPIRDWNFLSEFSFVSECRAFLSSL